MPRGSMDEPAIRIESLSKTYAAKGTEPKRALNDVSFDVPRGQIFGLLGPNGAGKSTLINILAGLVVKSSGKITIWGFDIDEHPRNSKRSIGVVPQEIIFDPFFTPRETLEIQAGLYGVRPSERKSDELLAAMHLTDKAHAYSRTLSGGMKRRLTIARALVNSPRLLLLDEPTTGLDPQARHLVWERLFRLKQQGVTLVLTTHYMDEAEQLCDRLVVMDRGKIVAEGSPQTLIDQYSTREVTELRFADDGHADLAGAVTDRVGDLASRVEVLPDRLLLYANDGEAAAAAVSRGGLHPTSVLVRRSSLEDVFLRLTGRSLVD